MDSEQPRATTGPASGDAPSPATELLLRADEGEPLEMEELTTLLYAELRRIAERYLRAERADHTLQPTALVHEAFMRLVDQDSVSWAGRAHFLAIAASMMRRVLIDHARRRSAVKRDRGRLLTTWPGSRKGAADPLDLLQLHDALERLAVVDPRAARVVELRYFGGLEVKEAAEVLDVSERTVKRDWRLARAWLTRELDPVEESSP